MNSEKTSKIEFAEICGIHAGDGWMSSTTNEVGYGTSPKEEPYFQEVLSLYEKHFDMKHLRILRRLAVEFRFQSKIAQSLLIKEGFVRGKKLDHLKVPKFVFEDKERIKPFLRLDFCVFYQDLFIQKVSELFRLFKQAPHIPPTF